MAAYTSLDPRSELPAPVRLIAGWLPGVVSLFTYERPWLRSDVPAALVLLATVLPQSLAYGRLAGLPGILGVYAAVAAMLAYALAGPTRAAMLGPDGALAVLAAAAVANAGGGPARTVALTSLVALIAGVLILAAGLARAGFLADLLASPLLVGYQAGVAVVIAAGQLAPLLGLPAPAGGISAEVTNVLIHLHGVRPAAVLVALVCFVILLWLPRVWLRAPAPLLAVLACMALVPALQLQRAGPPLAPGLVGSPLGPPAAGAADVTALLPAALLIALLALTDAARVARERVEQPGRGPALNGEMVALGLGNLAAGLVHGLPVTISRSRTETAVRAGAKTHLAGLLCAGLLLAVLGPAQRLLTLVPPAALAAIVVVAAIRLVEVSGLVWLWRRTPIELGVALAMTVAVLLLGVLEGALVAVVLSGLWLLWRLARPHEAVLGSTDAPGLLVYRMDAPLCFATAGTLERRALRLVAEAAGAARCLALDVSAVDSLDTGAAQALTRLRSALAGCGVVLALAGAGPSLRRALLQTHLLNELGPDNVHSSVEATIDHFQGVPDVEH